MMKYILLLMSFILGACDQQISFPAGGFEFPKYVTAKDSFFYVHQLKDSLSTLDSLDMATYGKFFFSSYKEPNLSISPNNEIVFRFVIYSEYVPLIITLTKSKITIKRTTKGDPFPYIDKSQLDSIDQELFHLSERFFDIMDQPKPKQHEILFLEAATKRHPQISDINYYQLLKEKAVVYNDEPFKYSVTQIPIADKTFHKLADLINNSGFWSLPSESLCDDIPMGVSGFSLEANTATKYKIVKSPGCPNDTRSFTKACQALVNEAGLGDEIKLIWDWP